MKIFKFTNPYTKETYPYLFNPPQTRAERRKKERKQNKQIKVKDNEKR